ncbi:MAG: aminodeoxychorismate/anthranilate synthase component II [Rickettsiales bacterium]|nr:aminodeoxychorismate/anthranilate synthase component II [Rickettsiales bacterium]
MTILLVDNFDSFSFNLYQMMGAVHPHIEVVRNDATSLAEIRAADFSAIVLSPGPGRPEDSGICQDIARELSGELPLLGVCLGHQTICAAEGARIVRAELPVHGKASKVEHDGLGLFQGLPQPFEVGRYHSLIVDPGSLPPSLEVSARCGDEIMAIRHRSRPTFGVQFHPESILTPQGELLLQNFLNLIMEPHAAT